MVTRQGRRWRSGCAGPMACHRTVPASDGGRGGKLAAMEAMRREGHNNTGTTTLSFGICLWNYLSYCFSTTFGISFINNLAQGGAGGLGGGAVATAAMPTVLPSLRRRGARRRRRRRNGGDASRGHYQHALSPSRPAHLVNKTLHEAVMADREATVVWACRPSTRLDRGFPRGIGGQERRR